MLEVREALGKVLEAAALLGVTKVPLADSPGRILRQEITAQFDLPRFTNSAMDGYAVRAADLAEAKPEKPIVLRLASRIAAGEEAVPLEPGTCARLFTGSVLPIGADAIVMQEDTHATEGEVKFFEPVTSGEFVRERGSDIRAGAILAKPGEQITFGKVAALSACGIAEVTVGIQPRIALLATGSELKEPGQKLGPAEIFESNRTTLSVLARKAGASVGMFPIVRDDLEATTAALSSAFERADVVVTTGGVSVGELDFVKEAFKKLGGELGFWRIKMRPGKPFLFGKLGEKLLCGLPGNPVSAAVTFFILVRPLLLRMQGATNLEPGKVRAELAAETNNDGNRTHYMRVQFDSHGEVVPEPKQGSHMLSSLLRSDGLMILEPGQTLRQGTQVEVLLWK